MAEASFTIRAVDATRQAFLNVQNSLEQLKKSSSTAAAFMKKAFDPRAIGGGLAAVFGISMVAAVDKAIEALDRWARRFAEVQKNVRDAASEASEIYRQATFDAMTPEMQLADVVKRRREMEKEIVALREKTKVIARETMTMDRTGVVRKVTTFDTEATVEESQRLKDLTVEAARLDVQMGQLGIKVRTMRFDEAIKRASDAVSASQSEFDRLISESQKRGQEFKKSQDAINKDKAEQAEEGNRALELMKTMAERQKDILDPTRELQREIDLINKLEAAGLLTLDEAIIRREQLTQQIQGMGMAQVETLVEANDNLEEMRQLADDVGDSIGSAFEDAIFSGNKLSDVLKNLAQDLMRLIFRNVITAPLAGGISNAIQAAFGFRAEGGPARAGSPYIVGEKGPELFVPGSSGTVIPNDRMTQMGGSAGGTTVNISYNIQSGVSRAELQPILENERKRLKAEIP
ncbi:MAG: hypothetical protein FJY48_06545, partial [Betaproteobacteria bacterium]|nr:hypothetical protein [Betaproteobacteria bacterium]